MISRGNIAGLEPVADVRQDAAANEVAHGVSNRALLVVEQRVDVEVVERVECRRPFRGRGHLRHILRNGPGGLTGASARA